MTRTDVVVLGGGVIGLTTAVLLAEAGAAVRVRTREPAARTTSAVAGGLWGPHLIGPADAVARWAAESFTVFAGLAEHPEETGVRMTDGVYAVPGPEFTPPAWAAAVPGARPARPADLPPGYRAGYALRVPLIDMPAYLAHLTRRLTAAGGTITPGTATGLAEAADGAPVLVNCTGIGARDLTGDDRLRPVRGQVVVVENPGVTRWFVDATEGVTADTYLFPQPYGLLLGGTAHPDAWDLTPDPATADAIRRRCAAIDPRIATARVLAHRTGLRPVRPEVRLHRDGPVVHHYGHGGAGVTVSWATAREAAALALGQPLG